METELELELEVEPEPIPDSDPVPEELRDGETVLEAGAYEGIWIAKVCEQYPNCRVYAFEPASRAYKMARQKLKDYPNVILQNVAIGKQVGPVKLCDRNRDGANTYDWNPENEPSETVNMIDAGEAIKPIGDIAVAHLNAEGSEVDILERMIEEGLTERTRVILVQWHPYDDKMRSRIMRISETLEATHDRERRGAWCCWIRRERTISGK